jgi:hypothetical protein
MASRKGMVPQFVDDNRKELPSRCLTKGYKKLHNLYGSRNIIRVNKSRALIRAVNVAHFGKMINCYEKPERNRLGGGPGE